MKSIIDYSLYLPDKFHKLFRDLSSYTGNRSYNEMISRLDNYAYNTKNSKFIWRDEVTDVCVSQLSSFINTYTDTASCILNLQHKNPLISDYCLWRLSSAEI
jgi:hypothetical protein